MNVFDASSCVGVVGGVVAGGWLGYSWLGVAGIVFGVPLGAIAGAFTLSQLVYSAFLVGIYSEAGLAGVWEEIRPCRGASPPRSDAPEHGGSGGLDDGKR